jgi:anti-sigma B factor antagonist
MTAARSPEITVEDGVTIVALGPEYENLDEHGLDDLRETLLEVASSADPPLVVLDLSQTKFFGSAFIEVLFRTCHRLNGRDGGRFCISGLTPYCAEVISITHLDRLWQVAGSREKAVKAVRTG